MKKALLLTLMVPLLYACDEEKNNTSENVQNTRKGKLTVYSDDSFKQLIEAEEYMFEKIYEDAEIDLQYIGQNNAVQKFSEGAADFILIGKELSADQLEILKSKRSLVQAKTVAYDGLALVVNKKFNKSLTYTRQLKRLFQGNFENWSQFSDSLPGKPVIIVTDKSNSSNLVYLNENFDLKRDSLQLYAAGSNEQVLEYVKENPYALGIVGAGFLSDAEDPEVKELMKELKVLKVSEGEGSEAYSPDQKYIFNAVYPLTRPIVAVYYSPTSALTTGFASFLLSEKGQKIILKEGLIPAQMPERSIQVVNEPVNENN